MSQFSEAEPSDAAGGAYIGLGVDGNNVLGDEVVNLDGQEGRDEGLNIADADSVSMISHKKRVTADPVSGGAGTSNVKILKQIKQEKNA